MRAESESLRGAVRRLPEAARLADLLRNSLVEVVGDAGVSSPYPIKVSPRSSHELAAVLHVCVHHRVSWSFDGSAEATAGEFDVVLSLAILLSETTARRAPAMSLPGGSLHGSLCRAGLPKTLQQQENL